MQHMAEPRQRPRAARDGNSPSLNCSLRQGGVYALPNGTEVVVGVVGREGHYFLYDPLVWAGQTWIVSMPIANEIDANGEVFAHNGQPTRWRVEDLLDTHRTGERGIRN